MASSPLELYASYLLENRLIALGREHLRVAREMEVPLLRLFAHLDEEQILEVSVEGLRTFLASIVDGRVLASAAESQRQWEADELPGIPRDAIEASDLVLLNAAQKQAILSFMEDYTQQLPTALGVIREIDALYVQLQEATFKLYAQMRERDRAFVESLLHHVPACICYVDRSQRVRMANPALARITGRPLDAVLGSSLPELFPTGLDGRLLQQVIESGEPISQSGFALVPRNSTQAPPSYWDFTSVPVFGHQGQVQGILIMAVDVTARVENEKFHNGRIDELQKVDRLKDEFLSVISHELRTPINTITGFGSALDDEVLGPLNDKQHHYIRRMLGGADMLLSLVNDLLDLGRMRSGRFSLLPSEIQVRDVLNEVHDNLMPLAEKKEQALEIDVPTDLPPIEADGQRLGQVLVNLVGNAIKFTPAQGSICVRVRRIDDGVRFEVCDSGPGIAREDIGKLFKRFSQLDTGDTRSAGGSGLGLSISKALVDAHGGQIGVESVVGVGSTFWFELPSKARQQGEAAV